MIIKQSKTMGTLHYHPCSLLRRSRDTRGAAFQNCQGVQGREGTWGGRSGQQKIRRTMKQLQDQGGFDNQKLILLELLDLATPHLPEGFEAIARAITFTLPLLWTELKRGTAMHCKIHCALSFRSNSPARVCIARIGTSADMTTVMTLLL